MTSSELLYTSTINRWSRELGHWCLTVKSLSVDNSSPLSWSLRACINHLWGSRITLLNSLFRTVAIFSPGACSVKVSTLYPSAVKGRGFIEYIVWVIFIVLCLFDSCDMSERFSTTTWLPLHSTEWQLSIHLWTVM